MKVTAWVDVSQEVTVHIGAEDIRIALNEAFDEVKKDEESIYPILRAFSAIASFLIALTDEQIELLTLAQRTTIRMFLNAQVERYSVLPGTANAEPTAQPRPAGGKEE